MSHHGGGHRGGHHHHGGGGHMLAYLFALTPGSGLVLWLFMAWLLH